MLASAAKLPAVSPLLTSATLMSAFAVYVQTAQRQRPSHHLGRPAQMLQSCHPAGMWPWPAQHLLMQSCWMMQTQKLLLLLLTGVNTEMQKLC